MEAEERIIDYRFIKPEIHQVVEVLARRHGLASKLPPIKICTMSIDAIKASGRPEHKTHWTRGGMVVMEELVRAHLREEGHISDDRLVKRSVCYRIIEMIGEMIHADRHPFKYSLFVNHGQPDPCPFRAELVRMGGIFRHERSKEYLPILEQDMP